MSAYTVRLYSGSSFTRKHYVYRLRDPAAHLRTDLGLYVVDPAKVLAGSTLTGYAADGTTKTRRAAGYRLWIERTEQRFGRMNAVTTHGTYYSLDSLLREAESRPAA